MIKGTKEFLNGYADSYGENIGTIMGLLGAPLIYRHVGNLLNLPTNEIIYGMFISAAAGAVLGRKYLNRVFNKHP